MKKLMMIMIATLMVLSAAMPAAATGTRNIGSDKITFTNSAWTSPAIHGGLRYSTNQGIVRITVPQHRVVSYRAGTKPTMEVQVYAQNGVFHKHITTFYYHPLGGPTRTYSFNVDGMSASVYHKNVAMYAKYRSNYRSSTFYPLWRD